MVELLAELLAALLWFAFDDSLLPADEPKHCQEVPAQISGAHCGVTPGQHEQSVGLDDALELFDELD